MARGSRSTIEASNARALFFPGESFRKITSFVLTFELSSEQTKLLGRRSNFLRASLSFARADKRGGRSIFRGFKRCSVSRSAGKPDRALQSRVDEWLVECLLRARYREAGGGGGGGGDTQRRGAVAVAGGGIQEKNNFDKRGNGTAAFES